MIAKTIARLAGVIAFCGIAFAASEIRAETYTFSAPSYRDPGGSISNWAPACGAPNCFVTSMTVSGSFTTAAPLPPNATTTVIPLSYTPTRASSASQ